MEFFDVVLRRRSIRKFINKPVSDEAAIKILDAARLAPSGGIKKFHYFLTCLKLSN